MSFPEGWEWLDEVPEAWVPPEVLLRPTRYPHANLAIMMLTCETLGHDVRAWLGRFITEHSVFTSWFEHEIKRSDLNPKEVALLSSVPLEQTRVVYGAWKAYEDIGQLRVSDESAGARRRGALVKLAEELRSAVAALARTRGGRHELDSQS